MKVIIYGDELYHHGVKGMKWGVRRYQNLDGSLKEAGKRARQMYKSADNYYNDSSKNAIGRAAAGLGVNAVKTAKRVVSDTNTIRRTSLQ